jgi:hypothetical protein
MFVRFGNIGKEGFIGRIKMTDSNAGNSTDAMDQLLIFITYLH